MWLKSISILPKKEKNKKKKSFWNNDVEIIV